MAGAVLPCRGHINIHYTRVTNLKEMEIEATVAAAVATGTSRKRIINPTFHTQHQSLPLNDRTPHRRMATKNTHTIIKTKNNTRGRR
jgi:hypothetical protein